jgi:dihydrofolate reductase
MGSPSNTESTRPAPPTSPILALHAAVGTNGVARASNGQPWQLPGDLKHLRELTIGKPVIMTLRTFELIKGPLSERSNIVVADTPAKLKGADVAPSFERALEMARTMAEKMHATEIAVIGIGLADPTAAALYAAAIPHAQRAYLTRVDDAPDGEPFLPMLGGGWRESHASSPSQPPNSSHTYRFTVLERQAP